MQYDLSVTEARSTATVTTGVQLTVAFLLGLAILYGAGFSPTMHNAAHDGRHSQAFPCH